MTIVNENILSKDQYFLIKDTAIKILREREKNGLPKMTLDDATACAGTINDLSQEARNVLIINLMIPDDVEFINKYKEFGKDVKKTSEFFGVPHQVAIHKVYEIGKYQQYFQMANEVVAPTAQPRTNAPIQTATSEENAALETESLAMINELAQSITNYKQTIVDQELTISSLQSTIKEQDQILKTQSEMIANHKSAMSEYERKIAELEGRLQVANTVVANIHAALRTNITQIQMADMPKTQSAAGPSLTRSNENPNQMIS